MIDNDVEKDVPESVIIDATESADVTDIITESSSRDIGTETVNLENMDGLYGSMNEGTNRFLLGMLLMNKNPREITFHSNSGDITFGNFLKK